jgi:hypothetical protein
MFVYNLQDLIMLLHDLATTFYNLIVLENLYHMFSLLDYYVIKSDHDFKVSSAYNYIENSFEI